jgi:hypothetical protein
MSQIQDDQTTGRAEQLLSELKAIELWDAIYKRSVFPFWYDHIAFVSRQKRRAEITRELQRMSDGSGYASHPASNADLFRANRKTFFERQQTGIHRGPRGYPALCAFIEHSS